MPSAARLPTSTRLSGLGGSVREMAAIATAELRTRRLVRTWLFAALALVVVLGSHVLVALVHGRYWGDGLFVDVYTPRFAISWLGAVWLWLFLVAAVFLAFDTRPRDLRERVAGVLDSRPISNGVLLGGRLVGLVLTAWLPLVAALALIQVFGLVSETVHAASGGDASSLVWMFAVPIEPVSLAAFLTIDALPALALTVAIVLFLASTLRNRLLTVVVALTLIGLHIALLGMLPVYLLPAASLVASHAEFGSDIVPRFADWLVILQRASILLFAGGFLAFAAAADPRRDDGSPGRRLGLGAALLLLGAVGIGTVSMDGVGELRQRQQWLAVHESVEIDGLPHIERVAGTVRIDPGKTLEVDLELRVTATNAALEHLVFSFNPGLTLTEVAVDGGDAPFEHAHGLLTVELAEPLAAGSEASLSMRAAGVPDGAFAHLDSAVDWRRLNSANPLLLLGTHASIFESEYVALPPDLHWLPVAGPNVEDPARGRDFHLVDLTVEVPAGWLVAGPGRRQETAVESRFRFAPDAVVPSVGVFAAPFERHAVEVAGIEFELLLVAEHLRNVRLLAGAEESIVELVGDRLERAERYGLAYPYGGFSVVEVPGRFRSYAGGWRLETALFPPAVMLLRETGLPLARLEHILHSPNYSFGPEGDDNRRKAGVLRMVTGWTRTGGNDQYAVRNLVSFQTGATGPGAAVLDLICRELAARLVWGNRINIMGRDVSLADFSAHHFDMRTRWGVGFGPMIDRLLGGPNPHVLLATSNRPPVWEAAEHSALLGIEDSGLDARLAVDVLSLKGGALVDSIVGALRSAATGELVAELVRRHRGGHFDLEDLLGLANELNTDIPSATVGWLTAPDMPGFLFSEVSVTRTPDDDQGQPGYQVLVHIRNDEPTPGVISLVMPRGSGYAEGEVVPVPGRSAVEIGQVLEAPPREVWLNPYLSLNRTQARLTVADANPETVVERLPFFGARPSEWRPPVDASIIVDDLDPGFSVRSAVPERRWFRRRSGLPEDTVLDRGLPEFQFTTPGWTRQELPTGYGKYRRTAARVWKGGGEALAAFAATLPTKGRWRLDYHVPDLGRLSPFMFTFAGFAGRGDSLGNYDIKVVANGSTTAVEFDADEAAKGWNKLGEFDLDAREVLVEVSDLTTGLIVVADAIRWVPIRTDSESPPEAQADRSNEVDR